MERPSHLNYRVSHYLSHRLVSLGLAVTLPLAVLYALTHDLVGQVVRTIGPIEFVKVDEKVKPTPPPPLPKLQIIDPLKAVLPVIDVDQGPRDTPLVTPQTQPSGGDVLPPAGPSRAPAAIAATHTIPPYPMAAQRAGAEGKVVLRLTVLTDGHVGKADIVTSSGRSDLDESARDWIMAHWVYKPALDKGQPAVAQTLASVVFSLSSEERFAKP